MFYLIEAFCYPMLGALRGLGKTTTLLLVTVGTQIVARQIYLFVMANYISNDYLPIVFAIPFGIIANALVASLLYVRDARRGIFDNACHAV
jgi:Na+-driven multidrug efflux pump